MISNMVLSFVLSTVFDLTTMALRYSYSFGRYLVYGHEETLDEKLDRMLIEYTEIKKTLNEEIRLREERLREERLREERDDKLKRETLLEKDDFSEEIHQYSGCNEDAKGEGL